MNSTSGKKEFNPSGVGLKNGNFIGLPFTEETAKVIIVNVPWDVTVSYREGTAGAPESILEASVQLDLFDADVNDAWKLGIFMQPVNSEVFIRRNNIRPKALKYIDFIEEGGNIAENNEMKAMLNEINYNCEIVNEWIYAQTKKQLDNGKLVALLGGDHSVPLGYLKALAEKNNNFGILQIDAHHDLRNSYEGFTHSHASIFNNALRIEEITKLVQIGIRDYCDEEVEKVNEEKDRISVFYDKQLKENRFRGMTWNDQCEKIISELPENIYVSFDVDGLNPTLCPNTGTPVPGGLEFDEVIYLLNKVVESGRKIIGFDLCEVGSKEWDANVGARILYKLCNLMGKSMNYI